MCLRCLPHIVLISLAAGWLSLQNTSQPRTLSFNQRGTGFSSPEPMSCPSVLWHPVKWEQAGTDVTVTAEAAGPPDRGPDLLRLGNEGGVQGCELTVPPEAAWCALLCCSSSFTVIFTRTP